MSGDTGVETPGFLAGGGEMGAAVRAFDWSNSPLGPPRHWPQSLKSYIGLMLKSTQPMFMAWGEQRVWLYNDAFIPILGRKHPSALGRPTQEVWAEAWGELKPLFDRVFEGESIHMANFSVGLDRRGRVEVAFFDFSYTPVNDDHGTVCGLFGVCIETTARVNAEREQLRQHELMWRHSQDLLVVIDTAGVFQDVSDAATTILGHAREEMIGKTVFDFIHPDDVEPSLGALAHASSAALPSFVNRFLCKDGSYKRLSWVAAPFADLIYATARDVTLEHEQAEALAAVQEAFRQSQKMEAVGQLTGGVAHDFNNLLTVIQGSVELLRRPNLSEERRARYIDAIGDTADRAVKLTSQLLAFSRRQTLTPETFDVADSIDQVANIVLTLIGSRVQLDVVRPKSPLAVNTDRTQFDTAIVNMAVNARDAMDGEGRLTIECRAVSSIPARRGHRPLAGDFVAVTISDTGVGISEGDITQVFEPFFTTKDVGHGTGLGLSQVIGFAKQSGGDISIESTVGQGSAFTLYLPRVDPATEAPAEGREENLGGEGICVLVVEDNESVGSFAVEALNQLGYDSILAEDPQHALAELASACDRFHVVFSDVVMPGMSGVDLGEIIRRDYPDIAVILTSGYSHVLAQDGQHGFELLRKPYSVEQLSRVLRKAIARQQTSRVKAM